MYVKSNTILGDAKHREGVVLAEIVKANIPVRNGVVHLIHRPLMIIDTTVTQFLQVCGVSRETELYNCSHNTDTDRPTHTQIEAVIAPAACDKAWHFDWLGTH